MNKIKFSFFLIFSLFLFAGTACKPKECFSKASPENRDNRDPKVVRKEKREDKAQYKKAFKRHLKQQTPETRKRIKQNLKQQQKNYKAGKAF